MKYYQTVNLDNGIEIELSSTENCVYEIESLVIFGREIEKPWTIPTDMAEAFVELALEYMHDDEWRANDD